MPLGKSNVAGNCSSGPASCTSVRLKLPGARLSLVCAIFSQIHLAGIVTAPRPRSECKWHDALRLFMGEGPWNHRADAARLDVSFCVTFVIWLLWRRCGRTEGQQSEAAGERKSPGRSEVPSLVTALNRGWVTLVGFEADAFTASTQHRCRSELLNDSWLNYQDVGRRSVPTRWFQSGTKHQSKSFSSKNADMSLWA